MRKGCKLNIKLALLLILSTLAVVFVTQNVAVVEIGFLFWKASISSALLIFITLMFGFFLGWFLNDYLRYRKYKGRAVYSRSEF
jgi:uncharacterized integral membrane protein